MAEVGPQPTVRLTPQQIAFGEAIRRGNIEEARRIATAPTATFKPVKLPTELTEDVTPTIPRTVPSTFIGPLLPGQQRVKPEEVKEFTPPSSIGPQPKPVEVPKMIGLARIPSTQQPPTPTMKKAVPIPLSRPEKVPPLIRTEEDLKAIRPRILSGEIGSVMTPEGDLARVAIVEGFRDEEGKPVVVLLKPTEIEKKIQSLREKSEPLSRILVSATPILGSVVGIKTLAENFDDLDTIGKITNTGLETLGVLGDVFLVGSGARIGFRALRSGGETSVKASVGSMEAREVVNTAANVLERQGKLPKFVVTPKSAEDIEGLRETRKLAKAIRRDPTLRKQFTRPKVEEKTLTGRAPRMLSGQFPTEKVEVRVGVDPDEAKAIRSVNLILSEEEIPVKNVVEIVKPVASSQIDKTADQIIESGVREITTREVVPPKIPRSSRKAVELVNSLLTEAQRTTIGTPGVRELTSGRPVVDEKLKTVLDDFTRRNPIIRDRKARELVNALRTGVVKTKDPKTGIEITQRFIDATGKPELSSVLRSFLNQNPDLTISAVSTDPKIINNIAAQLESRLSRGGVKVTRETQRIQPLKNIEQLAEPEIGEVTLVGREKLQTLDPLLEQKELPEGTIVVKALDKPILSLDSGVPSEIALRELPIPKPPSITDPSRFTRVSEIAGEKTAQDIIINEPKTAASLLGLDLISGPELMRMPEVAPQVVPKVMPIVERPMMEQLLTMPRIVAMPTEMPSAPLAPFAERTIVSPFETTGPIEFETTRPERFETLRPTRITEEVARPTGLRVIRPPSPFEQELQSEILQVAELQQQALQQNDTDLANETRRLVNQLQQQTIGVPKTQVVSDLVEQVKDLTQTQALLEEITQSMPLTETLSRPSLLPITFEIQKETPVPTRIPMPAPVPTSMPSPEPVPEIPGPTTEKLIQETVEPKQRIRPRLESREKPQMRVLRRKRRGVTWKQNKLWITLFPPFSEEDIFVTRSRLNGTEVLESPEEAFDRIQERGFVIPFETFDEWVQWFTPKVSRKVEINFVPVEVTV
jgi:hypothetical protein